MNQMMKIQNVDSQEQRLALARRLLERDPRLESLFEAKLTWIAQQPIAEQFQLLGGESSTNPGRTEENPKRWADRVAKEELLQVIQAELTDEVVEQYFAEQLQQQNELTLQRAQNKRIADYRAKAKMVGLELQNAELETLLRAEQFIAQISLGQPVNLPLLRTYLIESLCLQKPMTLFFVRCLRFAYPAGKPFIIPDLLEFEYVNYAGEEMVSLGSNVDSWMRGAERIKERLEELSLRVKLKIGIADNDLPDVRGMEMDSPEVRNAENFVRQLMAKYPESGLETISQMEQNLLPELRVAYRDLFYRVAAYLIGISSSSDIDGWNSQKVTNQLDRYGVPTALRGEILAALNRVDRNSFPITTLTLERATSEEIISQARSLVPERVQDQIVWVYTALRIARDIAQIGVLLPNAGSNVVYISDRAMKAVDFGYIGNRVTATPKLPTIFLNETFGNEE